MVAAEVSGIRVGWGKTHSTHLIRLATHTDTALPTNGREEVIGVILNNNLPLFDSENTNSQTFDQYTQTASWHLSKIALYEAVGLSQIDLA